MGEDEDMKSDKIIKITVVSSIMFLLLSILALTYAYFSLEIEGNPKDIVMSTGELRLVYKDETELKLDGAFPGDSISKVITVKNVGTKNVAYSLYWGDLINTIENYELHVTLNCKSYTNYGEDTQTENGTCENIYRAVPMSDTVTTGNIKGNISIEPNITHEYTVTVKFDNKNYEQNYNKKKSFTGKIGIQEYTAPEVINCTYDGEMVQGAEYVNGQYTYKYKQEGYYTSSTKLVWTNITTDGWGVQLTDKTSTDAVTDSVCTYINDKPVVSTAYMYANSQTSLIDLSKLNTKNIISMRNMFYNGEFTMLDVSSFDTRNVTNMSGMFQNFKGTILDLSNFDTSSVLDMSQLFYNSKISTLNLSGFDTSNVTNMRYMFSDSKASSLDLNNFNTSKVTDMSGMFKGTVATTIDVSNFDTSNVTGMYGMFQDSKTTNLDVSNFNTSNVTDMRNMFYNSKASNLDVSNFNTSKVTSMYQMFAYSKAKLLNLSSFGTSKVIDMSYMFAVSAATEIKGLDKFDTSNVTDMNHMFWSTKEKKLDVSSFDTSKVTNMSSMFVDSQTTTLDVSHFNTSKVINMESMFSNCEAVILDVSNFDTSNVTNMRYMFSGSKASSLNLNNFNTSKVTSMFAMFRNIKTEKLDLSSFDTSKVTDMDYMFYSMPNLLTIYVSNKFVTDKVTTTSPNMFSYTTKLVGGSGTKFDNTKTNKTYARIDGGTNSPGYFTLKQ